MTQIFVGFSWVRDAHRDGAAVLIVTNRIYRNNNADVFFHTGILRNKCKALHKLQSEFT